MISNLKLSNFKAFSKADLPLGKITLLTGLNSSGKSTVLQSIALVRQTFESHQGSVTVGAPNAGMPLNGDYVQLGTGRDILHEDFKEASPSIGIQLTSADGKAVTVEATYLSENDVLPLIEVPFSTFDQGDTAASVLNPGFQYLRADRINPATTYGRSYEMSVRRGSLGSNGEYTIDYLRHHQDDIVSPHLCHPREESHRLLAQVNAWLGEICPGVRITAESIDTTDLVRFGVQFVSPRRPISSERRPTNVGFGLTYVLPVIVACITAKPGSMILLENPEAHVHPRGQSAMARLASAAARDSQVVVETHSDHVLNGVRLQVKRGVLASSDVQIHYFHRPEGGTSEMASPKIDSNGMLSYWPEGFFDEWDESLEELLR